MVIPKILALGPSSRILQPELSYHDGDVMSLLKRPDRFSLEASSQGIWLEG